MLTVIFWKWYNRKCLTTERRVRREEPYRVVKNDPLDTELVLEIEGAPTRSLRITNEHPIKL